jgi:spore coat polysaccharide biosynthesis protein SpsF
MLKTGIITQARMMSTRLPGKVMLRAKGITMLEHHINRMKESGIPLVVATSTNPADDAIVELCRENNCDFFRGSENDVLQRYYDCAKQFGFDVIIRVTSDCPLNDGALVKRALNNYLQLNNDRTFFCNTIVRKWPRGFDLEIFSFDMLVEAHRKTVSLSDREHVTPYFYPDRFSPVHHCYFKRSGKDDSNMRITLDTPEDLILIKKLIEEYDCEKKNDEEIIELMRAHPELASINAHIEQKKS